MSPTDVRLAALKVEVERDWREVERQLERARSVDPRRSAPEAAFVALALDHAYQAMEQILLTLERALRLPERSGALRLPERSGEHWHRSLLRDAAESLPGVRPPLIPVEAEGDWEKLLGFRHFLRHAYAVELDPLELARNVERLERAVAATKPLVAAVVAALDPGTAVDSGGPPRI
jgi:hypothetical protein